MGLLREIKNYGGQHVRPEPTAQDQRLSIDGAPYANDDDNDIEGPYLYLLPIGNTGY